MFEEHVKSIEINIERMNDPKGACLQKAVSLGKTNRALSNSISLFVHHMHEVQLVDLPSSDFLVPLCHDSLRNSAGGRLGCLKLEAPKCTWHVASTFNELKSAASGPDTERLSQLRILLDLEDRRSGP